MNYSAIGIALALMGAEAPKDSLDRDFAADLPRVAPVEPRDALATFQVAEGFRLELVAHEPLVVDPVAMAFDEDARLYVVEMRDYSEQAVEKLGRVRRLVDRDGDGKYDESTVYVEGLSWPTAVFCWEGGVFVAAPPDLYYCKDTDGDGRADVQKKIASGFSRENVQAMVNTFAWGLDNRIHGATSTAGAALARDGGGDALPLRGRDFSFDPRTLKFRPESGGAQHGMSFNDWGEKFVCSNGDHLQQVMFEDRYAARNPYFAAPPARASIAADGPQAEVFRASPVEAWRVIRTRLRVSGQAPGPIEGGGRPAGYFTGATGVTICRGDAFLASAERRLPESASLYNCALVADVGSNLVHRKRLDGDGLPYVGRRIDEKSELIASTDIWFRPVQMANGPDGALYIADMYREVIEHPASLPPVIKKHLDLTSGRDRGRIYRLVPAGFKQPKLPQLSRLNADELVGLLVHSNAWQRETAARLLYERQDRAAVGPLRELAVDAGALPQTRVHALYLLAGLRCLSPQVLLAALNDAHPRVRQHAVRLSEAFVDDASIAEKFLQLAGDDDLHVRYQLAFTLGELHGPRRDAALAKLAVRDGNNSWMTLAIMSSVGRGAGGLLTAMVENDQLAGTPVGKKFITLLAAQIGKSQQADDVAALLHIVARLSQGAAKERSLAQMMVEKTEAQGALAEQIAAATGGRSDEWQAEQFQKSRERAHNEKLPIEARVAAIHRLNLGPAGEVREAAAKLISPEQPAAVQQAALAVLGRLEDDSVAELLIARWPQLGPAARSAAIEVLLTRDSSASKLLAAIESQQIAASEIPASRLAVLATHRDAGIRGAAQKLLDEKLARRGPLVAAYQSSLEKPGDAERGRGLFAKHCASCHRLGGVGHEIGPSLASAANRGAESILVNVLDPNREVNPQFVSYVAVTRDGRAASGILSAESATSITLVRGEKASDTLLRIDLDELKSTGMSLMPEGLEKEIDPQEMADLLSYVLQSGAAQ